MTGQLSNKTSLVERIYKMLSIPATVLGIAATIISIKVYFKVDSTMEAFNHRARLVAVPSISESSTESGQFSWSKLSFSGLEIENIGDLPAKDVQIVAEYQVPLTGNEKTEVIPPMLFDSTSSGTTRFITLRQLIAPQGAVKVKLDPAPATVWVSNEFGERSMVWNRFLTITVNGQKINIADFNNSSSFRMNTKTGRVEVANPK